MFQIFNTTVAKRFVKGELPVLADVYEMTMTFAAVALLVETLLGI